ncbi:MAG: DinB family protein [Bryobacteraceae bacterium]
MTTIDKEFVEFSAKKMEQLVSRIRDCAGRLSEEQIWARHSENENAVGNLMLHLAGNVRQWILSGVGGDTDIRVRDAEFAARGGANPEQMLARLEDAVRRATVVIRAVTPERLAERVTIQKYDVTVMEAIYHVVEHFAQHTGQIMFATKLMTGSDLGYYKHLTAKVHEEKTP